MALAECRVDAVERTVAGNGGVFGETVSNFALRKHNLVRGDARRSTISFPNLDIRVTMGSDTVPTPMTWIVLARIFPMSGATALMLRVHFGKSVLHDSTCVSMALFAYLEIGEAQMPTERSFSVQ